MTLEELQAIPLQYTFGYSADSHGLRQYVNQEHKIAKQVYTPRNKKTGEWGTGKTTYRLLDKVDTGEEFDTLAELLAAINKEKF
ncbi:hypothetical protein UFOVP312_26 [uncultured Caudovirales phage]|uniref:Uncharacterized protein n=1 Tax=uncultured Caudovirales phage TaxID=2100421 RepID=A0A6J5LQP9_9CAUD|nr:hypothetical protein UFOVP312_26 [uncultured Caudovirales phage]